MKAVLFVASCLCLLSFARAQDPANANLADFAGKYEAKCHEDYAAKAKLDRKQGNALSKADQIRAESLEKAKCQCMAGKIRAVTDSDLSRAVLAKDSTSPGPSTSAPTRSAWLRLHGGRNVATLPHRGEVEAIVEGGSGHLPLHRRRDGEG